MEDKINKIIFEISCFEYEYCGLDKEYGVHKKVKDMLNHLMNLNSEQTLDERINNCYKEIQETISEIAEDSYLIGLPETKIN